VAAGVQDRVRSQQSGDDRVEVVRHVGQMVDVMKSVRNLNRDAVDQVEAGSDDCGHVTVSYLPRCAALRCSCFDDAERESNPL
jgi:hypothetical protein